MTLHVPRLPVLDPVIGEAKQRARQRRFFVSAALAALIAAAVGLSLAVSSSPRGSGSPSGRPGPVSGGANAGSASGSPTSSDAAFLRGPIVRQFAASQGIRDLQVLVSAGSRFESSAVIVGTNRSGEGCWTVVAALGAAGGAFRCGTVPGVEQGEPAAQRIFRVGCGTSGGAGSATADAASCIGFVGPSVANVEARLVDGSTLALPVTEGAFAYAGRNRNKLPVSFNAYDTNGHELGHQAIILASGLGTNGR